MSITPAHVNDMAKLIAAMNAGSGEGPEVTTPVLASSAPVRDSAMANIMESFRRATEEIVETQTNYPELKDALVTEATETGARVGSWEISKREVPGMGKFYDVTHVLTREAIATDLRLYEAALALVEAFRDGETITSSQVKTILILEGDYARALSDAVGFAARIKITEGYGRILAESRYSESKRKALVAKKALAALTRL